MIRLIGFDRQIYCKAIAVTREIKIIIIIIRIRSHKSPFVQLVTITFFTIFFTRLIHRDYNYNDTRDFAIIVISNFARSISRLIVYLVGNVRGIIIKIVYVLNTMCNAYDDLASLWINRNRINLCGIDWLWFTRKVCLING